MLAERGGGGRFQGARGKGSTIYIIIKHPFNSTLLITLLVTLKLQVEVFDRGGLYDKNSQSHSPYSTTLTKVVQDDSRVQSVSGVVYANVIVLMRTIYRGCKTGLRHLTTTSLLSAYESTGQQHKR